MKKFLAFLLCLFIFASPVAEAARGFGSTFGTGTTTDHIISGSTFTLGTTFSLCGWAYEHGTGGGGFGVPFSMYGGGGTHTFMGTFHFTGPTWAFERDWSTAFPVWTMPAPSQNAWHPYCWVYDGGSTSNKPAGYLDATAQTVTTAVAPTGTLATITQAPYIGDQNGGGFQWDGMIAEHAIWNNVLLTANEAAAFAKGVSPLKIRPGSLTYYAPLYGTASPEFEWGPSHYTLTVTGTGAQNHAPVTLSPRGNPRLQ